MTPPAPAERTPTDRIVRVAMVRVVPVKGDLAANFQRLREILGALADHHPDVVVTPECFLDGFVATEPQVSKVNIERYAIDPHRSEYSKSVSEWAAANRCWVILGCSRRVPGGVANSALVYDRTGKWVGAYDKISCKHHSAVYIEGRRLPIFDADFGRFGVMICNDRTVPEISRGLALRGALIIFNPSYGGHHERNDWLMRIRSKENEIPIAFTHPRQSLFTDFNGEIVCSEKTVEPPYTVCEVGLAAVALCRENPESRVNRARRYFYDPGLEESADS